MNVKILKKNLPLLFLLSSLSIFSLPHQEKYNKLLSKPSFLAKKTKKGKIEQQSKKLQLLAAIICKNTTEIIQEKFKNNHDALDKLVWQKIDSIDEWANNALFDQPSSEIIDIANCLVEQFSKALNEKNYAFQQMTSEEKNSLLRHALLTLSIEYDSIKNRLEKSFNITIPTLKILNNSTTTPTPVNVSITPYESYNSLISPRIDILKQYDILNLQMQLEQVAALVCVFIYDFIHRIIFSDESKQENPLDESTQENLVNMHQWAAKRIADIPCQRVQLAAQYIIDTFNQYQETRLGTTIPNASKYEKIQGIKEKIDAIIPIYENLRKTTQKTFNMKTDMPILSDIFKDTGFLAYERILNKKARGSDSAFMILEQLAAHICLNIIPRIKAVIQQPSLTSEKISIFETETFKNNMLTMEQWARSKMQKNESPDLLPATRYAFANVKIRQTVNDNLMNKVLAEKDKEILLKNEISVLNMRYEPIREVIRKLNIRTDMPDLLSLFPNDNPIKKSKTRADLEKAYQALIILPNKYERELRDPRDAILPIEQCAAKVTLAVARRIKEIADLHMQETMESGNPENLLSDKALENIKNAINWAKYKLQNKNIEKSNKISQSLETAKVTAKQIKEAATKEFKGTLNIIANYKKEPASLISNKNETAKYSAPKEEVEEGSPINENESKTAPAKITINELANDAANYILSNYKHTQIESNLRYTMKSPTIVKLGNLKGEISAINSFYKKLRLAITSDPCNGTSLMPDLLTLID